MVCYHFLREIVALWGLEGSVDRLVSEVLPGEIFDPGVHLHFSNSIVP
jgi:hypothetical protein